MRAIVCADAASRFQHSPPIGCASRGQGAARISRSAFGKKQRPCMADGERMSGGSKRTLNALCGKCGLMKKMNKRIRQTRHLRLFIFSIFFINPHSPHQRRKPGSEHRGRAVSSRNVRTADSADFADSEMRLCFVSPQNPQSAHSALSATASGDRQPHVSAPM